MKESEPKTREEINKRRAIIFLIAAAVIGAGIWLFIQCNRPDHALVLVYYRGNVDINMEAKVFFRKDLIGGVEDFEPGIRCVHLLVRRPGVEERDESLTLREDHNGRIIDPSLRDLFLVHTRDKLTITSGDASLACSMVRLPEQSQWVFILEKWRPGTIEFNGEEIRQPVCLKLPSGYPIRIGNVVLQWDEPGVYTEVELAINTEKIFEKARLTRSTLPTITATLSTGFALARPGIRLILAPDDGLDTPLVDRMGGKIELVPSQDIDIYAALNQIGGYLTDRRYMYSPPHNRVERMVEDVNVTLATARGRVETITADVNRITADASYYLSSPAAMRQPPKTRLDSIVNSLHSIGIAVESVRADINNVGRTINRTVNNVDRTTVPRVNISLDTLLVIENRISDLALDADRLINTVNDTTLITVEGVSRSIKNDVSALKEELQRLAYAVNMLLIRLQ